MSVVEFLPKISHGSLKIFFIDIFFGHYIILAILPAASTAVAGFKTLHNAFLVFGFGTPDHTELFF